MRETFINDVPAMAEGMLLYLYSLPRYFCFAFRRMNIGCRAFSCPEIRISFIFNGLYLLAMAKVV